MSGKTSGKRQTPINNRQPNNMVAVQKTEIGFSGPVPHPDILKGYEDVLPGAAERILSMAEREAENRHELQRKSLDSEIKDSRLGVVFSFILVLGCLVGAVLISYFNQTNGGAIASAVLGVSGIGTVITTLITSTRRKKDK